MNDWYGNLTSGAQAVRFYHYGNSSGYNAIQALHVGTINTSGSFQPFADGSGLNTRYNGRSVWALEWVRDTNGVLTDTQICIGGNDVGYPYNEGCSTGSHTLYYCYSSYSDLISVGASNEVYESTRTPNQPVWMGSYGYGNTGNGAPVYLTAVQNDNLPWGFYTDGE
jgi:hypothetical protein